MSSAAVFCRRNSATHAAVASTRHVRVAGFNVIAQVASLQPPLSKMTRSRTTIETLPTSIKDSLNLLKNNKLLQRKIPPALMKGYLEVRRAKAERSVQLSSCPLPRRSKKQSRKPIAVGSNMSSRPAATKLTQMTIHLIRSMSNPLSIESAASSDSLPIKTAILTKTHLLQYPSIESLQ